MGVSQSSIELIETDSSLNFLSPPIKPQETLLTKQLISSTRSNRSLEHIPTRIGLINNEEIERRAVLNSTSIASLLRQESGIQMQSTSFSSASQNIRIQGLEGRYTQLLKDGFPLFGGFSSGLSIMQTPLMDLQQVEVIKGPASTLFGGGAIGGLVNLISLRPEKQGKLKLMVDQTSAKGSTFNGMFSKRKDKIGTTLFTSLHRQLAYDPNEDEFSDSPEIYGLTINPSLFFYFDSNSELRVTGNATFEGQTNLNGDVNVGNADTERFSVS